MAGMTIAQAFDEIARRDGVAEVESIIRSEDELSHLRVERRGKSITLVSYPESVRVLHARLTHIEQRSWGLSLPRANGRWERTPFAGSIHEVMAILLGDLGFHLAER